MGLLIAALQTSVAASVDDGPVVLARNPHFAAFFIGSSVLLVALFSGWLRRHWTTGPMVALGMGMLIGPFALTAFSPAEWHHNARMLELVARATLAVSLMAVALHLPRSWLVKKWRVSVLFLSLAMVLMWGLSTLLMQLILPLTWLQAAILGAIITPTDPVLATTIVTGPLAQHDIPERLRMLLHTESAANDGLALAFVMLPLLLFSAHAGGLGTWGLHVIGWQIVGASLVGAAAGWLVGLLQKLSAHHHLSQYDPLLSVAMSLAIVVAGGIRALDGDGVLAVFIAGVAFRLTIHEDALYAGEEQVQEAVQRLFQLPIFLLFGMLLPWSDWLAMGWRALAVVGGVLLFRRLPGILLVKPIIAPIRSWTEALFCGWFGPIGISALFYAALAQRYVDFPEVWTVTSLLVAASTFIHGLSATPLARALGEAGEAGGSESTGRPEPQRAS